MRKLDYITLLMGQNRSYIHFAEDTQQTKTLWIIQNIPCFSSLILKSRALKKNNKLDISQSDC